MPNKNRRKELQRDRDKFSGINSISTNMVREKKRRSNIKKRLKQTLSLKCEFRLNVCNSECETPQSQQKITRQKRNNSIKIVANREKDNNIFMRFRVKWLLLEKGLLRCGQSFRKSITNLQKKKGWHYNYVGNWQSALQIWSNSVAFKGFQLEFMCVYAKYLHCVPKDDASKAINEIPSLPHPYFYSHNLTEWI